MSSCAVGMAFYVCNKCGLTYGYPELYKGITHCPLCTKRERDHEAGERWALQDEVYELQAKVEKLEKKLKRTK